MNREIRFRAWDKKNKYLGFVNLLDWNTFGRVGFSGGDIMQFDDVILMQYTGLKDKNGKEIYEGDIVQFDDDEITFGLIKWNEKYGRFDVEEYEPYANCCFQTEQFDDWTAIEHFEIIGNIYENPELLGGKP